MFILIENEIVRMEISKVKKADYNPREMSELDFDNLCDSISKFGQVGAITVNKRTGYTIVGGNHTLDAMKMKGYKHANFTVIDIPQKYEKALNVALNRISGVWEETKLKKLLSELDTEVLGLTGLTDFEIDAFSDFENEDTGTFDDPEYEKIPIMKYDTKEGLYETEEKEKLEEDISYIKCPHCGEMINV